MNYITIFSFNGSFSQVLEKLLRIEKKTRLKFTGKTN